MTIKDAYEKNILLKDLTPYSDIDPCVAATDFLQGKCVLPHVGEVELLENGLVLWGREFLYNEKSSRLWLYSLVFVDYFVKSYAVKKDVTHLVCAVNIFCSFLEWMSQSSEHQNMVFQDEHSVCNRVLILIQFLNLLSVSDVNAEIKALEFKLSEHIYCCCNWLATDTYYAFNNHGVMMDRALLNAYVFFRNRDASIEFWKDTAFRRISVMISKTFDNDGCCTENSTSYHILNVSLFNAVRKFSEKHNLDGLTPTFFNILEKAISAVALQVYENGSLPLIGDSYSKPSVYLSADYHKNIYGSELFSESGLFFLKQQEFYFSFKCGGLTTVHRHIDDTSITLQVKGINFICDGGMHSYDAKDPIRTILSSHLSHSGIFTEDCKHFRFKNYENCRDISSILKYQQDHNFVTIKGVSNLDPEALITREIAVFSGNRINVVLVDDVESELDKVWRVQFLLHPDVSFAIRAGAVDLKCKGVTVTLIFSVSDSYTITSELGYYSESFMGAQETSVIVVSGRSKRVNVKTFISCIDV